jgi:hypothetical protein
MKSREGYVYFDERSKKWIARFSPFVNATTRKNFTRSRATRKEALKALRELIQQYETKGLVALDAQSLSFEQLADRYREAKMIEAEFVGERKVAGMRAQSSSQAIGAPCVIISVTNESAPSNTTILKRSSSIWSVSRRSTANSVVLRIRIGICSSFAPCSITQSLTDGWKRILFNSQAEPVQS